MQPSDPSEQWHTGQPAYGPPAGGQYPGQPAGVPYQYPQFQAPPYRQPPGIKSDAVITIAVDGREAGRIRLEPNSDPVNYTCVSGVWRTTNPTDLDSWNTYERQ